MRKKIIFSVLISSLFFLNFAHAATVKLNPNKENCEKIDGYSSKFINNASDSIGLPKNNLSFMGAKMDSYLCQVLFNTSKGVYQCHADLILSDDSGKTAFAGSLYGPRCEKSR